MAITNYLVIYCVLSSAFCWLNQEPAIGIRDEGEDFGNFVHPRPLYFVKVGRIKSDNSSRRLWDPRSFFVKDYSLISVENKDYIFHYKGIIEWIRSDRLVYRNPVILNCQTSQFNRMRLFLEGEQDYLAFYQCIEHRVFDHSSINELTIEYFTATSDIHLRKYSTFNIRAAKELLRLVEEFRSNSTSTLENFCDNKDYFYEKKCENIPLDQIETDRRVFRVVFALWISAVVTYGVTKSIIWARKRLASHHRNTVVAQCYVN